MVTENGAAFPDVVGDGRARSPTPTAIDYLRAHLAAVHARDRRRARRCVGYYVWSLLDNFEWAWGYAQAVRDRARRLRDAGAHAEGQRPVLRRGWSRDNAVPTRE